MRGTKAKRSGEPCIKSGKPTTANLDAGSTDRLQWARHTAKRLLKTEAFHSVLIRRAIVVYTQQLEKLLERSTPEQLEHEAGQLASAARGTTEAIPEDDLIAVPLRPFSVIHTEAADVARKAGAEQMRKDLDSFLQDVDHQARRRGHE